MGNDHHSEMDEIPAHVQQSLKNLVSTGHSLDQIDQWYRPVWAQHLLAQSNTPEFERLTSEQPGACTVYACPRCNTKLKQAKDYMRHAKQTCYAVENFSCPDCPKTFTRKHRFANHHKRIHPARCRSSKCSHVHQATKEHPELTALGCGFCGDLIQSGLRSYLRHLIHHFRCGASPTDWSYSRQLSGLLRQPLLCERWTQLCSKPMGDLEWPVLEAKDAISLLETGPSPKQLKEALAILPKLANAILTPDSEAIHSLAQQPLPTLLSGDHSSLERQQRRLCDSPEQPVPTLSIEESVPGTPVDEKIEPLCPKLIFNQAYDNDNTYSHPPYYPPLEYEPQPALGGQSYFLSESEQLYLLESHLAQQYSFLGGSFSAPQASLYGDPASYTYRIPGGKDERDGLLQSPTPLLLDNKDSKPGHRVSWTTFYTFLEEI